MPGMPQGMSESFRDCGCRHIIESVFDIMSLKFLPITKEEVKELDWSYVDVVIVSGDAYVDHPSFGSAVIGRVLEYAGFRVAILAMPLWRDPGIITIFGKPRLFFGVTSGNVDSMISRFTAFKKVRNDDPYAPGGRGGSKPEHAVIVYCNMIKAVYKDAPIVLGGIEASMRRFAHYDFWDDSVRRSILLDSRADMLVYGMGERQILEIARRLDSKESLSGIPGTVEIARSRPENAILLPPEEDVLNNRDTFLQFYKMLYENSHNTLAQPAGKRFIIQHPMHQTACEELDRIYSLPFSRSPHPSYTEPIPAFEMIKNSISSHRGCISGCAFCSLGLHQGKRIIARSRASVLSEIERITREEYFHGHITDIGGPSANMYGTGCRAFWNCKRDSCTYPDLCKNLIINTKDWISLLNEASFIEKVKHVTVGSGIRYDLFMRDDELLLEPLLADHVSGQLKVAPEHTSLRVLNIMRKTSLYDLKDFADKFFKRSSKLKKRLYILPYLMSCHPGCGITDMKDMKREIVDIFHFVPEQVQAYIPLPMTISSVIYYTGIDPFTGEEVFVERDSFKRRKQHQVLISEKSK